MKNFLLYISVHSIKIGYILLFLLVAISLMVGKDLPYGDSFWKSLFVVGGVVLLARLIFGGWSASSVKGMTWSAIMSTIGGLIMMIYGMKTGSSHSIHFWPILTTLLVSIAVGIGIYNFIDNYIDDTTEYSVNTDNVIDSLFSAGVKETASGFFNELMDLGTDQLYRSASRGVAAYSNTIFFLGLIVGAYYGA